MIGQPKTLDLCTPCAASMKQHSNLVKVAGGVDNKITCKHCGKRRFGATYEIRKKGSKTE